MTSGVRIAAALAVSVVGIALLVGGTAAGSSSDEDRRARPARHSRRKATPRSSSTSSDQADLSAAYAIRDQDARGWYVYRTLRRHAARTQAPIRALLESRNVSYEPRWAANVIVVQGDRSLVEALAARPDVSVIESNDASRWIQAFGSGSGSLAGHSRAGRRAWSTLPRCGRWATTARVWWGGLDTGIRWTHNALLVLSTEAGTAPQPDHNYNWWDSYTAAEEYAGRNPRHRAMTTPMVRIHRHRGRLGRRSQKRDRCGPRR